MDKLRLPESLERSQRILVAGAGGGFDVYAGLPIYNRLRSLGKTVFLANLSFTYLQGTNAPELSPCLYAVDESTAGEDEYFPERTLCRFASRRLRESICVYAFESRGAKPIREAYSYLIALLNVDAVVLVDGGTDILLRGDEASLGTPAAVAPGAPAAVGWRDAPGIFQAVQEQLGLKLVPAKGPLDLLVIDHIERPIEN